MLEGGSIDGAPASELFLFEQASDFRIISVRVVDRSGARKGVSVLEGRGAKVLRSKALKQRSVSTMISFVYYHRERVTRVTF
jgi:hypothetical protein